MKLLYGTPFLLVFAAVTLYGAPGNEVSGRVVDAAGGQPLANVEIQLGDAQYRTVSDETGEFRIGSVVDGSYMLRAATVGYRTFTETIQVSGPSEQLRIVLSPEFLRRTETVLVVSHEEADATETGQFELSGGQLRNLGSVLADDPLRAIQAVPGVSSGDDFESRFSLRGAGFDRIGVYLDGVLLHEPLHTLDGTGTSGSASVFNTDMLEGITVYKDSYPDRFQDSSAGALDVRMRDGNADRYSTRIFANFASAGFMAEGPIPGWNRCSWIAGFRKSYLQYLLQQTLTDPSMAFGIQDEQGRLSCTVSPTNVLTFEAIESNTDLNRSSVRDKLGRNSLMLAGQDFSLGNLGWKYTPNDRFLATSHLAWMHEGFQDQNKTEESLGGGGYREWVANSTASWMWNGRNPLNFGASVRNEGESGFTNDYLGSSLVTNRYRGNGTLTGGFLEQTWSMGDGRLLLSAGGRWDHHSIDGVTVFSPRAGMTFNPWRSLRVELGWGQYTQFPQISELAASLGRMNLLPMRSTHAVAALEQRIGDRTSVRAEFYQRDDRDLIWQPLLEARIAGQTLIAPDVMPRFENSLSGRSRGAEFFLKRTSANGWTGWVSYAYGKTTMHDSITGDSFPSDWDQRHALNVYGSYRIRPSVNVSARWTYGSGFPVPGYLQPPSSGFVTDGQTWYIVSERNRTRLGAYERTDVRINKSWAHRHWTTTLFGEVMNVTNRMNYRYDSMDGYSLPGRAAWVVIDRMFPILPSVGVVFER